MNYLIYKIKNKFFRFSKEASKIKRPSFEELIYYKSFERKDKNRLILSLGAGRCGQNWVGKIFNSHPNWIGTSERFSDMEAFYRYITYYNLPVAKDGILKLFKYAVNRDFAKYQNSFIASPYFSFGVEEICNKLHPNFLFFQIRNPIKSIESFYRKGWYSNLNNISNFRSPLIDISNNLTRNFSRIFPKNDFINEWSYLTTIGKISWFWATINKKILDDLNKIKNIEKIIIKLEDADQNYEFYEKLSIKFDFKNKMNRKQFYNVINKAPNKGPTDKYEYNDWSNLEKKEFDEIINKIFPFYEDLKTKI